MKFTRRITTVGRTGNDNRYETVQVQGHDFDIRHRNYPDFTKTRISQAELAERLRYEQQHDPECCLVTHAFSPEGVPVGLASTDELAAQAERGEPLAPMRHTVAMQHRKRRASRGGT